MPLPEEDEELPLEPLDDEPELLDDEELLEPELLDEEPLELPDEELPLEPLDELEELGSGG